MLRLGAILHRIKKTQFSHANLLGASRLSTTTTRDQTTSAFWGSTEKISPVGSPAVWVFEELDEMAKMGEDVGKDDIEFNMDLLLNKACYLDALEVFIKSSDFIYLFFSIWVINCISLCICVFY